MLFFTNHDGQILRRRGPSGGQPLNATANAEKDPGQEVTRANTHARVSVIVASDVSGFLDPGFSAALRPAKQLLSEASLGVVLQVEGFPQGPVGLVGQEAPSLTQTNAADGASVGSRSATGAEYVTMHALRDRGSGTLQTDWTLQGADNPGHGVGQFASNLWERALEGDAVVAILFTRLELVVDRVSWDCLDLGTPPDLEIDGILRTVLYQSCDFLHA